MGDRIGVLKKDFTLLLFYTSIREGWGSYWCFKKRFYVVVFFKEFISFTSYKIARADWCKFKIFELKSNLVSVTPLTL